MHGRFKQFFSFLMPTSFHDKDKNKNICNADKTPEQ